MPRSCKQKGGEEKKQPETKLLQELKDEAEKEIPPVNFQGKGPAYAPYRLLVNKTLGHSTRGELDEEFEASHANESRDEEIKNRIKDKFLEKAKDTNKFKLVAKRVSTQLSEVVTEEKKKSIQDNIKYFKDKNSNKVPNEVFYAVHKDKTLIYLGEFTNYEFEEKNKYDPDGRFGAPATATRNVHYLTFSNAGEIYIIGDSKQGNKSLPMSWDYDIYMTNKEAAEAPAEPQAAASLQGGGKKGRKTRKKSNRKTKKSGKKSGKKSRKPRRK